MKKVLIVAYSFPPAGGGRVRRVLKFIKYLQEYGWLPLVLTVNRPRVPSYDDDLLQQVAGAVRVTRTKSLEPDEWMKKIAVDSVKKSPGLMRHILNRLRWCLFIPDHRIGWIPFAVVGGYRAVKQERIDVIMVMGEPFSSFITGVILKFITGKPLVLDFRDEWSEFNKIFFPQKNVIVRKIEELLEKICVGYSDAVVTVTQPIVDNFIRRYPSQKSKFFCVTNGFDPEDFAGIAPAEKKRNVLTFTHSGSLYKDRSPGPLLDALDIFLSAHPDSAERLRVIFIGTMEPAAMALIEKSKWNNKVVFFKGFLKHKESVQILMDSDILLYIMDQTPISERFLPAKLFEYLAAGKPILALCAEHGAGEIIRRVHGSRLVSPLEPAAIAGSIGAFYDEYTRGNLRASVDPGLLDEFSRRNLTKKLADILTGCLKNKATK